MNNEEVGLRCGSCKAVKRPSFGCKAPLWCVFTEQFQPRGMKKPKNWGSYLPQGYVEKLVRTWNDTPTTQILAVTHLYGRFLCVGLDSGWTECRRLIFFLVGLLSVLGVKDLGLSVRTDKECAAKRSCA